MKTRILGLDPGIKNIGLALYLQDTQEIEFTEQQEAKSLLEYSALFSCVLKELLPHQVVCEKPFSVKEIAGLNYNLTEIIAVQRLECERLNIPWIYVSPTFVKKQFTGNGRADKNDIQREVIAKFDRKFKSTHINDAIAIAVSWADKHNAGIELHYR